MKEHILYVNKATQEEFYDEQDELEYNEVLGGYVYPENNKESFTPEELKTVDVFDVVIEEDDLIEFEERFMDLDDDCGFDDNDFDFDGFDDDYDDYDYDGVHSDLADHDDFI